MNKLEVFNEVCILGASYHLLLFTDYIDDVNMQYLGGWSMIGVTVLNITVNMGVIIFFTFLKLLQQFK